MGFPTRITRSALGPKFRDTIPVENPETDVGAQQLEQVFQQVVGANLIVPRVVVIATYSGGAFQYSHRAEAWNPDGAQAHPELAWVSAGNYTLTFAASYLDENAVAVPTVLLAPRISSHRDLNSVGFAGRVESRAWIRSNAPLVVQIRMWDTGGTGIDQPFWLEVF